MKGSVKWLLPATMLFISVSTVAQSTHSDIHAMDIDKNISRLFITVPIPDEEAGRLLYSYERELKKPFTLVLKAGPSLSINGLGFTDDPYRYTIQLYASVEFRYFFTLLHRIKKDKPVRNFSGLYLSLEQYVETNPIIRINEKRNEGYEGSTGAFAQIGYQKQIGKFYFNILFGPRLYGNGFGPGLTSLNDYHGAVGLGIVF